MEQFTELDGVTTFRPIGGTIEYGEDSQSAVIREVKEEINEDIVEPKLIGVIENIFPWFGDVGHEYDFIYEATFANADVYQKDVIRGIEGDKEYVAVWQNLDDFVDNPHYKLVPDGLYEMVMSQVDAKCAKSVGTIKHVNTKQLLNF